MHRLTLKRALRGAPLNSRTAKTLRALLAEAPTS